MGSLVNRVFQRMTRLTQEKAEHAIALVLRYGSLLATVIMAVGLGLLLVRGGLSAMPQFHRPRAHRIAVAALAPELVKFNPAAMIELGILLLLLTPIFRILVAIVTFALERDYKYVLVSVGVLAVVLLSISFAIES